LRAEVGGQILRHGQIFLGHDRVPEDHPVGVEGWREVFASGRRQLHSV
jgi:hypothetical protein